MPENQDQSVVGETSDMVKRGIENATDAVQSAVETAGDATKATVEATTETLNNATENQER
ncbi:hypothetical protein [Brevibacillus borstelensis]|uniref:hypothetical protein n=1 Tax=Brevibacillus borstelensis TaxID=45462 RepID=UPI0030BAF409